MANNRRRTRFTRTEQRQRQVKRIDVLPDDVLLDIFDIYVFYFREAIETWISLIHVCRRWRSLVLGSPRRLNLRLYCSPRTPARRKLGIWPTLPLFVESREMDRITRTGMRNIFAALEQSNRVCQVDLSSVMGSQFGIVLALMQVPFPELRGLRIISGGFLFDDPIPDSFLGGSVPRLQSFELDGIPFPGLPNLLSSATHLVKLCLSNIPHSGYNSPEAMVTLISALSSLRKLSLHFEYPQSRPDWENQSLPAPKRSIIPSLHKFNFSGVSEYLEDFLNRIDIPQLNIMEIIFLDKIKFDCPRLIQFINCTPKLRALDKAHLRLTSIKLRYRTSEPNFYNLVIHIPFREPWGLPSIEQVCNLSLHPLSMVEDLYFTRCCLPIWKKDAIENALWLRLLLPYTAVKNLYLSKKHVPNIAAILQELVGARITEVLPSLQNIFLEEPESSGPFQEMLGQFVTARRLSGHPVAILFEKDIPSRRSSDTALP